ncbi:MAG: MFS transporter [Methyloligellaceae bacterium]
MIRHLKNQKLLVVTKLGIAQMVTWGSTFFLPAILSDTMSADLKISDTDIYACLSGALVISAILSPFMGRKIDMFGGRTVMSTSSLLIATGLISMGLAENQYLFYMSWIFIGLGMSMGLYDIAFSTVARIYGRDSRSAMVGVTLIGGLASVICFPLSAYLEVKFGWRITCFIWAALHLTICFPLYRLLPNPTSDVPHTTQTKSSLVKEMEETVHSTNDMITMALVALMFVFISLTAAGTSTNLPRLIAALHVDPTLAIIAAALFGPSQILGRSLDLFLSSRFHPFYAVRFAFLFHPIGAISILIFGAPAAIVFVVLHGVGNGILTTAMGTVPLLLFGSKGYGWRQGILTVPRRLGMAAAPFVFALMLHKLGASVLLITTTTSLLGLTTLFVISSTRPMDNLDPAKNTA